ncbi:hypothetical protein DFQ27_002992 [Actinomortierella ambigua]|uniref:DNA-directed DNA polymerase n=1 Tax=Actinomortierella ambigua TaxID=1343610 RepID=A0A9P6Q9C9_9FUNG|nr:hypothetical protein DFQ27_002992 [Actinomortierella ambigua]
MTMELDSFVIQRRDAEVKDLGALQDNFVINGRNYQLQYAHLYFMRLMLMRNTVLAQARRKWGSLDKPVKEIEKVLDVQQGEISYLVGTVYMEMKLKPNILNDITKDHWIAAQPERPKYADDSDSVYLEDESGRVRLVGPKISKGIFVTGVIMGVLGTEDKNGDFEVVDVCYAGQGPQEEIRSMETDEPDKYVAFVSGLGIGGTHSRRLEQDLMLEYLTGELGGPEEQQQRANIVRVVIVGNSIVTPETNEDEVKSGSKKFGYDRTAFDAQPTRILDSVLQELSTSVHVDIMPGESDPCNVTLPQQPIHPALFPASRQLSSFQSVTNPYWCNVDGVTILSSSGQNVDDIYKYVKSEDRLEMAKLTLQWRHIAPTAPDTLWCYPFKDKDPFIMSQSPHVYVVGNQDKFATELVIGNDGQRTRVVTLPSFSSSSTIALVNLRTLECMPISFSQK